MELIKLKAINKIYGEKDNEFFALKDVDLEIKKGESIAIIGPSGSGKSTLLNILGLIDSVSRGEYYLEGKNVSKIKEKEIAKIRNEKLGFIFQNFNLLYDFNLLDNVMLPIKYSKKDKKESIKKAKELLKELGLANHINKTPDKLSGGQKQRVAIARALINEPDIILADEPTGALDVETGKEVLKLLKDINKSGKTVIIITHDINVAKSCEKIIEIKDGRIIKNLAIKGGE